MRKIVQRLGQTKSVILITVFSILASVLLTLFFVSLQQDYSNIVYQLSIGFIVPAIVAPLASWHLMALLLKVDRLEKEMRAMASYDDLTGLLNRRAFIQRVNQFLAIRERQPSDFALLMIDLDKFKNINDNFGHVAGDKVLQSFGHLAKATLRKGDMLGRLGGEEFVVLLPGSNIESAKNFAQRLHQQVRATGVEYGELHISFTVSIGITGLRNTQHQRLESLIKQADTALYQAKETGRDKTVVYC